MRTPLFLLSSLAAGATLAAALQQVNYGAFTQTATYSIANQLGFFTAYGLNVTFLQVPNSTYGYATLLNGGYDIMTGTIDNAVNLRFNSDQGLTVTGQLDQAPELTIASVPNITRVDQLKGLSLMVDSPVSGYAFILRKVLSRYGLYLENGDYTFQVRNALSDTMPCAVLMSSPGRGLNRDPLRRSCSRLAAKWDSSIRDDPDVPLHERSARCV